MDISVLIPASSAITCRSNETATGSIFNSVGCSNIGTTSTITFQLPNGSNDSDKGRTTLTVRSPEALSFIIGFAPPGGITVMRKGLALLGHINVNSTSRVVVDNGTEAEKASLAEAGPEIIRTVA